MADGSFKIEIDGREYLLPDDLDLNDAVELEERGLIEKLGSPSSIRFIVWRILRRDQPEITEEEAGAKVKFSVLMDDEDEEGPPPIPLSEPDPLSGTSGGESSGNGSTGTSAKVETHVAGGSR